VEPTNEMHAQTGPPAIVPAGQDHSAHVIASERKRTHRARIARIVGRKVGKESGKRASKVIP
jgi:hypothetical protein